MEKQINLINGNRLLIALIELTSVTKGVKT